MVYVSLAGLLTVFSGCKKDQPETTTVTEEQTMATDTVSVPADTTIVDTVKADANDQAAMYKKTGHKTVHHQAAAMANKATADRNLSKDKKGKSLEGYSAPDGTDAENHDGDQYSKNDNRRMPSGGTSMK